MTQFLVEDGIDFFFFRATDELPEFTNTSVVVALELVCLLCCCCFPSVVCGSCFIYIYGSVLTDTVRKPLTFLLVYYIGTLFCAKGCLQWR